MQFWFRNTILAGRNQGRTRRSTPVLFRILLEISSIENSVVLSDSHITDDFPIKDSVVARLYEEVRALRARLDTADWENGKKTAGAQSSSVKNNQTTS